MMITKPTNYRWTVCALLFSATCINYLDRQVLSLTWRDFIADEFHWTNTHYGNITALFSIFYAVSMLFAGRFVDRTGTKRGFQWAIGIWSFGAILHAFCGIWTAGYLSEQWVFSFVKSEEIVAEIQNVSRVIHISVVFFIFSRLILAIGEAGNFPVAIKATAEYFPKKDRAFATSIFNAGATVGALLAPLSIPIIAEKWGWEMAFILIGALGFIWMAFWQYMYAKPADNPSVNLEELLYINQDQQQAAPLSQEQRAVGVSIGRCLRFRQTWAFVIGKFLTDGVWWFFLFWMPTYLSSVYAIKSSDPAGQGAILVLYLITLLSIIGGWLPSFFITKKGLNPYKARMRAMLIYAFIPLLVLFAQPLGHISYWIPVVLIGIGGAAHQAWSANIFSTIGDMFPKQAIATVTGIGGLAGGIGAFIINKSSGVLFDYAQEVELVVFGFQGLESGYFIIFSICACAYLVAWLLMKKLVPKLKLVDL